MTGVTGRFSNTLEQLVLVAVLLVPMMMKSETNRNWTQNCNGWTRNKIYFGDAKLYWLYEQMYYKQLEGNLGVTWTNERDSFWCNFETICDCEFIKQFILFVLWGVIPIAQLLGVQVHPLFPTPLNWRMTVARRSRPIGRGVQGVQVHPPFWKFLRNEHINHFLFSNVNPSFWEFVRKKDKLPWIK